MSSTVTLPEPAIKPTGRGIDAHYLIGHDDKDEYGAACPVDLYAVLTVDHYGRSEIAGRLEYAYVIAINAESVEHHDGHAIRHRAFHIGGHKQNSVTLHVERDQPRYSAKVARRLLDEWMAKLPSLVDDNEIVRAIVTGVAR